MRIRFLSRFALAFIASQTVAGALGAAETPPVVYIDQGVKWTALTRADFYVQNQGSQMIPLAWLLALKQPSGASFTEDHLARYGYLPNPDGTAGLPVGFPASGPQGNEVVGMTCSACHTREITVSGQPYRIDGGPAIVDFQGFLKDLDVAVGDVVNNSTAFAAFAQAVLGTRVSDPVAFAELKEDLAIWYQRYHALIVGALPTPSWGPSRLDAVGMIFDRLTGLDLGPAPAYLLPDNIRKADAPVRYPFLWNAPIQDMTQWPGFADNGNDLLGLARNLGEVYGVFGTFHPVKDRLKLLGYNYIGNNSANFDGLSKAENLIKLIGPPRWPWGIDTALAARGQDVFNRSTDAGGCVECHGITKGKFRGLFITTWGTPIQDVKTDQREVDNIQAFTVDPGALEGASIYGLTPPLAKGSPAFNVLSVGVLGAIIQHTFSFAAPQRLEAIEGVAKPQATTLPSGLEDLQGAFRKPGTTTTTAGLPSKAKAEGPVAAYEARVLEGIWAAAPYLHNGSVPTLADLLKPVAERPKSFKIGPAYDVSSVGLAVEQTKFDFTLESTDCSDVKSGNSRCGHEFGTGLPADDKKALLEYLKSL